MLSCFKRKLHPPTPRLSQRLQLAGAHLHQGELRRHEKPVGEHEPNNDEQLQRNAEKLIHEYDTLAPRLQPANDKPSVRGNP